MKKKLAIYALYGSGEHMKEVFDHIEEDKDYTRLTEAVEVEFTEREQAEVVKDKIEYYEGKKERVRLETNVELERIDEAIKQLLVIEYKPDEDQ